ncbi:hypothetical protein MNBD_GAMMA21-230 [hydrothermal vent metagenome]|uniref:Uncharacterized protein n=1 Tax=hydrothermal vent metagenome TaxID=652676 RepID=A0A3B1AMQ4_9ZZZZ
MSFNEIFLSVHSSPGVAAIIWLGILIAIVIVMYFARLPAHLAINSMSRVLYNAMRLSARAVMGAEATLNQRNREVLLEQGREAVERIIEREFDRVDGTVRRDLSEYPALHRQLSEEITTIDDDYKESTEVPPEPPAWVKAVEAVAKIPGKDPMVASILEDIHISMVKANTQAIEAYRKSSHKRHEHLKNMMPHWRKVKSVLGLVDKNVTSLLARSLTIDRHMEEYESIISKTDRAVRTLSSSSLTQFFVSLLVLSIAIGGAFVNFNLIARPMAEMVGGTSLIVGFSISSIAALVIILVELSMGLFLMETMRITRLFPVIGALNDKVRLRLVWVFFAILFFLASVEAGLAFMREMLMEDDSKIVAALTGTAEGGLADTSNHYLWITTVAQMGLGFVLPFALMFVAIPLETFVHSMRTVFGLIGVGTLRIIASLLRLIGNIMRFFANSLVQIYDLIIFGPLWIEEVIKTRNTKDDAGTDASSAF